MSIRTVFGFMMALGLSLVLVAGCRKVETRSNPELLREAMAASDEGKWQEARALSYRAVQQNPGDVNALVALSRMLEQEGQFDQALAQLDQAVNLDPGHFAAQYNRGRILFEHDHLQDCPISLEKALALRPDHVDTRLLLAQTYAALGNHRDAIRHYVALARNPQYAKGGDVYNEIGVLCIAAGDPAKAAQFMTIAFRNDPENPQIVYNLAVLCDEHLKKPSRAVEFYNRYLKLTEGNAAFSARREKVSGRIQQLGGVPGGA
jgi:tetratricopeptide (TPR) repeat protein